MFGGAYGQERWGDGSEGTSAVPSEWDWASAPRPQQSFLPEVLTQAASVINLEEDGDEPEFPEGEEWVDDYAAAEGDGESGGAW